jgi:hypothetical protein
MYDNRLNICEDVFIVKENCTIFKRIPGVKFYLEVF